MLPSLFLDTKVTFIPLVQLRHIEDFSQKRVNRLVSKIKTEQVWTKPLCIDTRYYLVMDGQHRMEAARILELRLVPCVLFDYESVDIWSLRDNYCVDRQTIVMRSLQNNVYPYKTVKHRFPIQIPRISVLLNELI